LNYQTTFGKVLGVLIPLLILAGLAYPVIAHRLDEGAAFLVWGFLGMIIGGGLGMLTPFKVIGTIVGVILGFVIAVVTFYGMLGYSLHLCWTSMQADADFNSTLLGK
jgi:hypothetical protein